jgi:hypothetical protein
VSEFQDAIAEGLAAISAAQSSLWTFGSSTFSGAESDLKPNDPRMVGAPDRLIEIRVVTALLPFNYPKRGHEMTRDGETHRVHRVDHNHQAGISIFLVHRSSEAAPFAYLADSDGERLDDSEGAGIAS